MTVLVGTKLRYQIGYVRYNDGEEEFISSEVIGAISAITAILVSVGIVVLIVLKHKSTQVHNLFTFRAYAVPCKKTRDFAHSPYKLPIFE